MAGKVIFVAGKVRSFVGKEADALTGQDWLSLFSDASRGNLGALLKDVQKAGRIGPLMVDVLNAKTHQKSRVLIMGMTIPGSSNVYLTMNATESFFDFLAVEDYQDSRLLDEKQFESAAIRAFATAKKENKNLDVTFLEVAKIEEYKKNLSFEEANNFTENFQAVLKEQSFQGNAASCLAPQFSGVYYKKLQEVNLWNIYTTLTPELRRESDKKCGDSQESIAKLAKRY